MKHIIIGGCSHSIGAELPGIEHHHDVNDSDIIHPDSWASLVAKQFPGATLHSCAKIGGSNNRIERSVIIKVQELMGNNVPPSDILVLLMYTGVFRSEINLDGYYIQLGSWTPHNHQHIIDNCPPRIKNIKGKIKSLCDAHFVVAEYENHLSNESCMSIHHIQCYLNMLGIVYAETLVEEYPLAKTDTYLDNDIRKIINIDNFINMEQYTHTGKYTGYTDLLEHFNFEKYPGNHFGADAHKFYADCYITELKKRNIIRT